MPLTSSATAQDNAGSPSTSAPQPVPLAENAQWSPDEFQRALVTGTTMPMDEPLPFTQLAPIPESDSPSASEDTVDSTPSPPRKTNLDLEDQKPGN